MFKTESLSVELRQAFIRLIAKHTGLEIREQNQAALSEKIFSRMKALKLAAPENYYQILESSTRDSNQEWQKLVVLLSNIESYFFRDKEQFSLLRNKIFPELIERKKNKKRLRICSAGCSTGEEPYSLSILLKELLPDLEQWNLMILGIDINQEALKKARTGIYSPWSFRRVDPGIKRRYFRLINNQYHIDEQIKQMLTFQHFNLVKDSFPQPDSDLRDIDLIICRNVFIYFEPSTIAKVLDKFYHTLQPLGYLITGHAELSRQNLSLFQTKVFPESLVYQRQADNSFDAPLASLPSEPNYLPVEQLSLKVNNSALARRTEEKRKDEKRTTLEKIDLNKENIIPGFSQQNNHHLSQLTPKEDNHSQPTDEELLREAETLLEQKAYDLAIKQANKVLKINTKNFQAYHLMAQIHANLGKYEEAIHYCQKALEIDSLSVAPYYLLAQIAEEQGNLAEAKRILKKIIYLEPSSLHAYFELSHIYQQEGDKKRTMKMQQAAVDILKQLPSETQISERGNLTATKLI
ncbi:MAG: CheR family methyltransferase [Xenococcaceae cyanobacterium]